MSVDLRLDGERTLPDGTGRRVALVCGRFNEAVTTQLVRGAVDLLDAITAELGRQAGPE